MSFFISFWVYHNLESCHQGLARLRGKKTDLEDLFGYKGQFVSYSAFLSMSPIGREASKGLTC